MNNHWILQGNLIDQDQVELIRKAVEACGDTWSTANYDMSKSRFDFIDATPGPDCIPYGSNDLVRYTVYHDWDFVFFNENFSVQAWKQNRQDLVNQDSWPTTVGALAAGGEGFAVDHPLRQHARFFMRPDEDFKSFAGTLMTWDEVPNWARVFMEGKPYIQNTPSQDLVAWVAPLRTILQEWRWFVVDGRVISGACYMHDGVRISRLETDAEIIAEAQAFADVWLPHPCCVMDTALYVVDGVEHVGVLEFNNINTAGFYGHDIPAVVQALSKYATRHHPKLKCKDLPDVPILELLVRIKNGEVRYKSESKTRDRDMDAAGTLPFHSGCIFAGEPNSILLGMPMGERTPMRLAQAKARSMIKRKLIDGCACGCRGDFEILEAGLQMLATHAAQGESNVGG